MKHFVSHLILVVIFVFLHVIHITSSVLAQSNNIQYNITTIAGGGSPIGDGLIATKASLIYLQQLTMSASGEIYLTDLYYRSVRKISTLGIISTISGTGTPGYSGDGGLAINAQFGLPSGIATNENGDVFVVDAGYSVIRKISNGIISTIAGTGTAGYGGDNAQATSAQLNGPRGIAISSGGEIFIADVNNNRIRKISNGIISTIAGTGTAGYGGDNAQAKSAQLNNPKSVAISSTNEIYIADTKNNRIRKISTSGVITTVAGDGTNGYGGDGGSAKSAQISIPGSISIRSNGEIIIADSGYSTIRKVSTSGIISTLAGNGTGGFSEDGTMASNSQIANVLTITTSSTGEVYFADDYKRIRKISLDTGKLVTIAGPNIGLAENVTGTLANLSPYGTPSLFLNNSLVFVETTGQVRQLDLKTTIISTIVGTSDNSILVKQFPKPSSVKYYNNALYVLYSNYYIEKVTTIAERIVGTGITFGYSGDNLSAESARLNTPNSVTFTTSGDMYIADWGNHRIRKISSLRIITTVAGNGESGFSGDNGLATDAKLSFPTAVAFSSNGDMYIADSNNHRIRKVSTETGIISTIAGTGVEGFNGDNGQATSAQLTKPAGIAIWNDEIYFSSYKYNFATSYSKIRKISIASGIITTVVGGTTGFSGDGGQAIDAKINNPLGIAFSSSGDLYFSDYGNHRIRKIGNGTITTIAGGGNTWADGTALGVTVSPQSIAVTPSGEVLFGDISFHRIRKVSSGTVSTIAGVVLSTDTSGYGGDGGLASLAKFDTPKGVAIDPSSGDILIADSNNHRIRKISSSIITTVAGAGLGDGAEAVLSFINSNSFEFSSNGDMYIADSNNHRIRKVSNGIISTIAGIGTAGYGGDNAQATSAQLNNPESVAISSTNEIYIADTKNNRIRKISTSGVITTVAGDGNNGYGGDGTLATSAKLNSPMGVTITSTGEILIADSNNHRIRKISTSGIITTIIGNGGAGFSGDGGSALNAQLNYPHGLVIGSNNEIYILDANNNRIRKAIPLCNDNKILIDGSCEYQCYGSTNKDSKVCSGKGICIGNDECNCTSNYFGSKCENHNCFGILKNMSNVCSSHGNCLSPNNCSCFNGYYGNSCQYFYCNSIPFNSSVVCSSSGTCVSLNNCSCNTGYSGSDCQDFSCYGKDSKSISVCSSHGVCISLNNCSCYDSYFGSNCEEFNCFNFKSSNVSVCSGHGSCISPNNCSCNTGYYGSNCEMYDCNGIQRNNPKVCSGKGTCSSFNNCSCQQNYSGKDCELYTCYGISNTDQKVCSYHGVCTSLNNCSCLAGYFGNNCEQYSCYNIYYSNSSVCSGRGSCSSFNNCTCNNGYYGSNCELYNCYGLPKNNLNVCSGHGVCSSFNNCTCSEGYSELECSSFSCAGEKYIGQNLCLNNGSCSGPGNCNCPYQFGGARCEFVKCYNLTSIEPTVCGGHGTCKNYNNCSCSDKWLGEDCSVTTCFSKLSNMSSVCTGRGNCTNFDDCKCANGYKGIECQHTVCYDRIDIDSSVCSGNGKCSSPNNCTCEIGYIGNECQYHEIYLNTSSAILYSFHDQLMKLVPQKEGELFSCNDIFNDQELSKFGELSSVICQWRNTSLKIHLGYDYTVGHNSNLSTKFNISLKVSSLKETSPPTCTFGYSLSETSPLLDIVIRLVCDDNLQGFKKLRTDWSCVDCSGAISSLLNNYSNKSSIYIPISYVNSLVPVQGFKILIVQATFSSESFSSRTINKEVRVQSYLKALPPSYYWLSDNYIGKTYSCVGHNCILETSLNSLNSSLSYSFSGFFSLLNNELYSKQMFRMINDYSGDILDSEANSNMQVFGVQVKTYVYLPLSIDYFKYSTFTNLDFVMTGVNRTYYIGSTDLIAVTLTTDDPFITKYTLSDYLEYSWKCYKVSDRSILLSENLCSTASTRSITLPISEMSLGFYLITASISSTRYFVTTLYTYEGFIEIIGNETPKILTSYVSAITPSHRDIYLRSIVKSHSEVSFSWNLKRGVLKINEPLETFLKRNSISRSLFIEYNTEIILNIDNKHLIQGEEYEFELSTVNSDGQANVKFSTRVDFTPRLACSYENLKNDVILKSLESLVSISCVKLSYESISSFIMEIHGQNQRIGVLSSTPKKFLITRLPYSKDGISLVVKLQNLYGSIGLYTVNITGIELPNPLTNDNSFPSRLTYVVEQFQIIKNSQPIKMELSNEFNVLLSLLLQNETKESFSESISKLSTSQLITLNRMLREMLTLIKNLQDITYRVEEILIRLTLPVFSKILNILWTIDSSMTFAVEVESWLDFVYSGMEKGRQYYPSSVYNDQLDIYHLQEIISLQNIISTIYKNNFENQYKTHKYNLLFIKLTGNSVDNSTFVEDIEYSEALNDKSITLSMSNFKVGMKLPNDFNDQIGLQTKSKLTYSVSVFKDKGGGNLLQETPIIDLSLFDYSFNKINVKNISPPIIINFQGLITTNKTGINTSCIYYDTALLKWSTSGLESSTIIHKRTDDYIYFEMECRSSHLSVFSVQEVQYNSPPTPTESSNNRSSREESSTTLTILLATVLPIILLIVVLLVITLVVFIVLLFRKKKKEVANDVSDNIELSSDFPSEGSMFIKPLMSISSSGTSEAFNPLSRYSNLVKIGQGAFGSVFKAFDNKVSTLKAIKVIKYSSMEELNNFMKEGTQLMNVNHPYILRVNEFFVSKDQLLCIDMDFYELGDLVRLTNIDFECSENLIKKIMFQMCQALEYIHSNMKIIHRDIKPSNIFVKSLDNDDIHVIVADFGLAKSNIASTNTSYAGTPIFMSPELGLGGKYYYNTDIYSLGVTIYQIITKDTSTSISQLYLGKDQHEVSTILSRKMQDGYQYSQKLIDLVLQMLTKDNLNRPQAQDILQDTYFDELRTK